MEKVEPSILIGIPCLDTIKTETVGSLLVTINHLNHPTKIHIQKSCYVHDARNKIAERALEIGAQWLMFIDSDIQFPPEGINQLIARDKDIIGGLYYRRQPPHFPTIGQKEGDALIIPSEFPNDKPFRVFHVGTGFMLIKTKVFKEIKPPWFYFSKFYGKEIGEDVYFCWRAGQKFEVWCDPTIELGHVGEYAYDHINYDAYKSEIHKKKVEAIFDGEL